MVQVSRKTKLTDLIHYRIKVTTLDGRTVIGELLAFDKHMNLVLADTEEFRITKQSKFAIKDAKRQGILNTKNLIKEDKRNLGLIILRGVSVIGVTIETKPPVDKSVRMGLSKKSTNGGIMKPIKDDKKSNNKTLANALRAPIKTVGGFGKTTTTTRSFQPPPGFRKK